MIHVGLAGIGFMGWIHYLAYRQSHSARICGFASRDADKRNGDWRGIQGNFGPPGQQIDVSEMTAYATLDELINDPRIDVIDICLPPHMHVNAALSALQAGKHVLCEKPLALTSKDCDRVLRAADDANRHVFVAHVLSYVGPYQFALRAVLGGEYGKPIGGYFKRIISNPLWIPDFYDAMRIGGPMVDLHVHDTHFIQLVFGRPKRVTAHGPILGDVVKFAQVLYEFEDPAIAVSSSCGVIDQAGRGFTHGFELYFERATLQFEFAATVDSAETMPLKVLTGDGSILRPQLPAEDDIGPFRQEIDDMAACIASGKPAPRLDARLARDAIHLSHCIQRSVIEGKPIEV